MVPRACVVLALLAAVPVTACAASPDAHAAPPQRADAGRATFDTRADPAFGDATTALRALVSATPSAPTGENHFCVVGYRLDGGDTQAWVHWQEANRLILWEGSADPAFAADTIRMSRRNLDLATDVVDSEADIAGSTYLVTRAWVAEVMADCTARGTQYAIQG